MTELLCHTDSYVQEFDATVVAADAAKSAVVLDRTAFYPGGGGQPPDLG
jgi:misacylated tRNA(Ala) deacylase